MCYFLEMKPNEMLIPGDALREARELNGQSQMDLAYALGCDRKTVSRWEAGRHRMSGIYRRQLGVIYPSLIKQ